MRLYVGIKKLLLGCGSIRSENLKAEISIFDDEFVVVYDDSGEPCCLTVDCFAPTDWKKQK